MNRFRYWPLLCALTLLSACSSTTLEQAASVGTPALVLEDFFHGQTRAYGVVLDRSGVVQRQFSVDIQGSWDEAEQTLILDEDFVFSDGEIDKRIWTIVKQSEGSYRGTADDVIGHAEGQIQGNTLRWHYRLEIPYKGTTVQLDIDDWMYLHQDGLLNRASMKKWGIKVGEILLHFTRLPSEQAP